MQRVFLVSQPGIVRDATQAVLRMVPGVQLMGMAAGALSATRALPELPVDVLLIDANVPQDEMLALLNWVKERCPEVRCVVMAITAQQQDQAFAWGADWAIKRADLSSELRAVLSGTALSESSETVELRRG